MMLHLLLVRHGETDWNAEHRYQGQSDLPLNQRGIEQARCLAARLQFQEIDVVYSSDLQRAAQTAALLVGTRGLKIQTEPRLREMSFGLLEGHTFDEAQRRWPQMINDWLADYNQPPEGGERLDDFSQRVREFYLEVKQNYAGKNLLVVAHGGPLREILYHVLRLSNRSDWWFNFDHASLTDLLIHDERIVVNCLNDTGHLNFW